MTLDIVIKKEKENKIKNIIDIGNIDKYIIELIRVSALYKFELKIKLKDKIKRKGTMKEEIQLNENMLSINNNIDVQVDKAEEEEIKENLEKIRSYEIISVEDIWNDIKIVYNSGTVKMKNTEHRIEYHKPKKKLQELWEKEGFYQEKTTQSKVRVQLWPEHLPYDHFKRRRAFLFC